MFITMVKKELADGNPCQKCKQAEDLFKRRELWGKIDEIVVAKEGDPESPGMKLAARHDVKVAPFFIVRDDGKEEIYTSALQLIRERLAPSGAAVEGERDPGNSSLGTLASGGAGSGGRSELSEAEVAELNQRFAAAEPPAIVSFMLERHGADVAIAFSGAEDVALIDMAVRSGAKFSVFTLDTGRLHPETYRFVDKVRSHYGIEIRVVFPDRVAVENLVRKKGLFSFYEDGHGECCGTRKVEPLRRTLADYRAWLTGQRRDQSPTRTDVQHFELDRANLGQKGALLKTNPLAAWSLADTWTYLRDNSVPTNELHDRGFVSVGCEPCTRAPRPGEHERAGRWWWEEATKRECGLHTGK